MNELFLALKDIFINTSLQNKVNKYNYIALSLAAGLGHIVFGFYWAYVDPQIYESFYLRAVGLITCLALLSTLCWKKRFHRFIFPFWIFTIIYNLPFFFTVSLIRNHFSEIWFVGEATMIFGVILFLTNIIPSVLVMCLGIFSAVIFCLITDPESVVFDHRIVINMPIYFLTFIASYIFSYSNSKGLSVAQDVLYEQRSKVLKSLAGSIAHELRNPLNTISIIGSQISTLLMGVEEIKAGKIDESSNKKLFENNKKLIELTSNISEAIVGANSIIDIILSDLRDKPIDQRDFSYLKPEEILPLVISKYGYKDQAEQMKVSLNLSFGSSNDDKKSFIFKAVQERFTFIIYNLLKNSLYYLSQYPDSKVTIGIEEIDFNGAKYNSIYVHDTGPGIAKSNIPKLFEDFYTSGKKGGTGLGLAFCKRNMIAVGGDIICESEFGKWTKFSLVFPKLSEEEIKNAELESKKKKVLIVDDQKTNLLAVKSKIERSLPYISCDIAVGGKEGAQKAMSNKYNLILMDIQMPEVSGIDVAKKIRFTDKETPIIAITSLDYETFSKEIEDANAVGNFNYYISKSVPENILYRTVTKWMVEVDDRLPYLGEKEDYMDLLRDKSAILADDQDLNRMVTKNKLKSSGMKITEVKNGQELVEAYKKSLNAEGKSTFDIILTDINMPPYNGDEASMEVREIEKKNKIPHQNRTPIIALSGDGDMEAVQRFFKCQMTDYFVKGHEPESLIKIIANCFAEHNEGMLDAGTMTVEEIISTSSKSESKIYEEELVTLDPEKINSFSEIDRKEILNLFLKDGECIVKKVREYKAVNNVKDLSFAIHSIKGISSNIGADKLYDYIKEIELDLKSGKFPEDADWLEKFDDLYSELRGEIKKIL